MVIVGGDGDLFTFTQIYFSFTTTLGLANITRNNSVALDKTRSFGEFYILSNSSLIRQSN